MHRDTYLILRVAIAISMFGHGLVRVPKLETFAAGMAQQFEQSMLPNVLITPFAYILAIAELIIGLLLLIGLWTRMAAWAGALTMFILLFGSCLIENFGALPSQLIHTLFFAGLIQFHTADYWSLDQLRKR